MTAEGQPTLDERAEAPSEQSAVLPPGRDEGWLDIVDEWGVQSFPASDPPANW